MHPDQYMPYHGNEIEAACKGYTASVKWAYVSCQWHYWGHTHCEGLPDDDEYLRNVCDCPVTEWARTKPAIFGKFFKLYRGKWHHDQCREEYGERAASYNKVCAAAQNAINARWNKGENSEAKNTPQKPTEQPQAPAESSSEAKPATSGAIVASVGEAPLPDTERITKRNTVGIAERIPRESNSISISSSSTKEGGTGGRNGSPTLSEVRARASQIGLPDTEAENFFHHYEAINWVSGAGIPVTNWQSKLIGWRTEWQTRLAESKKKEQKKRYVPNLG